MLPAGVINKQ